MKIAIVHEWFTVLAGSEKVVEQLLILFPAADLYAVYADPEVVNRTAYLRNRNLTTTFIQSLPSARKHYRNYFPLMPLAIEQLDLSSYDLVISSAHAFAKGVLTGPDQLHISYVHSPIRYAWDLQAQYLKEAGLEKGFKGWIAKWFLHKIRIWDYRTAAGVNYFVSNSNFIGRRIKKVYGRDAKTIYPPVDVSAFEFQEEKQDYYLAASRLVPYKRMDLIVTAFNSMPNKKLVIIGDGPELAKLKKLAKSNISILGYRPFNELRSHMQNAKAFVFAAEEDFGITPVEAQACGTPVIAFGKGGSLETVVDGTDADARTGIYFTEQNTESVIAAIMRFESLPVKISAQVCRKHAEKFSIQNFRENFSEFVDSVLSKSL